jgi:hypothetical protein
MCLCGDPVDYIVCVPGASLMMYYQCLLRRESQYMTSWIEERGAMEGALVELLGDGGKQFWEVRIVYRPGIDDKVLTSNQKLNRGSLASIKQ